MNTCNTVCRAVCPAVCPSSHSPSCMSMEPQTLTEKPQKCYRQENLWTDRGLTSKFFHTSLPQIIPRMRCTNLDIRCFTNFTLRLVKFTLFQVGFHTIQIDVKRSRYLLSSRTKKSNAKSHEWLRENFSFQYQYNIKQKSYENEENS